MCVYCVYTRHRWVNKSQNLNFLIPPQTACFRFPSNHDYNAQHPWPPAVLAYLAPLNPPPSSLSLFAISHEVEHFLKVRFNLLRRKLGDAQRLGPAFLPFLARFIVSRSWRTGRGFWGCSSTRGCGTISRTIAVAARESRTLAARQPQALCRSLWSFPGRLFFRKAVCIVGSCLPPIPFPVARFQPFPSRYFRCLANGAKDPLRTIGGLLEVRLARIPILSLRSAPSCDIGLGGWGCG